MTKTHCIRIPDRSFTSVQMVHTHASLPRGFSLKITSGERLLSVPWSGNGFKIQGWISCWIILATQSASSENASMRRAWSDNVRVDSARWLAIWAKSAAEKIWTGCLVRSPSGSSSRSSIAMLASLSLLRMFQKKVASCWIWTGGGVMSTLATMDSVSSMPDPVTDAGLSGASWW